MQEKINKLQSLLSKLKPYDLKFASSLITDFKKYGKLTPKQAPWIDTLIERAEKPAASKVAVEVGNFSGVIALFAKAQQHLKHPKIVLLCEGVKIKLYVAGPTSKAAGSINIVGEGGFGARPWFGLVSPDGKFEPASAAQKILQPLIKLLQELATDPARVAKKYGKLTGQCCFCNAPLTDKRSTAAGFGPVCAKHFGLEHEWKTTVKKMEEQEAAGIPAPVFALVEDKVSGLMAKGYSEKEAEDAVAHAAPGLATPKMSQINAVVDTPPVRKPMASALSKCEICREAPSTGSVQGVAVCESCGEALVA
jgi:hypothetical protein